MLLSLVLAALAAAFALVWIYVSWEFDYWRKRGVHSVNSLSLFGDRTGKVFTFQKQWEQFNEVYKKHREKPFVGVFQLRRPALLLIDPEVIKTVLTKEFSSFHGRGQPVDEKDELSANLFNLDGPRWKNLRARLSPTFTSGKLKLMFPLMADIGNQLNERLSQHAAKKEEIEFKDLTMRYATDVIGSVAFGIDCNSLKDEDAKFHTMSQEIFKADTFKIIQFIILLTFPFIRKALSFSSLFPTSMNFFRKLMKDTVEYRETNKIERNDFVNLMMQLREADRHELDRVNHIEFTHDVMTAQAFLFFIAGMESITNTIDFALHELALNPELQTRAAEEVRDCMSKHGGMTYEAIKSMDLIERIVRESLRKWTPVGLLTREPTGPVQLPGTDTVIDKKVLILIPVWDLAHDPEYFPEPDRFDPDRFLEENKEQRHPYAYLPFGEGPRFCIAERFAVLEMKMCLASVLSKFEVHVGKKTDVSAELDPKQFGPTPKKGFWLRVENRL